VSSHPASSVQRLILHVDMDAFFASVEQLDNPELRGKPVIVGGEERGVVSACSYEARKFGVHSAMPTAQARRLCPQGVFVRGRHARYAEISEMVMAVLHDFSPLVEQASVDEAYMDVTGLEKLFGPPEALGAELKRRVREATGLNCSVGIAPVKFLAKIASDYRKPDGLFILRPEDVQEFLRQLAVGKIPGVGKRARAELDKLGIRFAADVLRYPSSFWEGRFGKWGGVLHERAQGLGSTTVSTHYEAKSESAENTFSQDTLDREELKRWLLLQAERVGARLRRHRHKGRTVTLKIKFQDFSAITRGKTLPEPTSSTRTIFETATALLDAQTLPKKVRLIGVGVSNFSTAPTQLHLFQNQDKAKDEHLDLTLDAIREKFGSEALVRGRIFGFRKKQ
jgi:DNA polymerase IV